MCLDTVAMCCSPLPSAILDGDTLNWTGRLKVILMTFDISHVEVNADERLNGAWCAPPRWQPLIISLVLRALPSYTVSQQLFH